jgi:CheY-like chemotaxis protein
MPPILVAGLDRRSLLFEAPMLQRNGEDIEERASARELLDDLTRLGGRLVVLGTRLPDLVLPEAIRRIRSLPAIRATSVLAVLPAGEPSGSEDELTRAGANAVLRRPFERQQLEGLLAKLLSVPRRVEARIPVQGQVVGTPRASTAGHFYGLSRNLSLNGMLLASPIRLVGAPDLDLEFHISEPSRRVRVLGRVVREAGEVGWPYLGYGVEFLFVPPDSVDAILSLVRRGSVTSLEALARAGEAAGIHSTIRRGAWIYEIVEPVPYDSGWLAEIRRGPREGWRPGEAGPYYVVEGASRDSVLREARNFVTRQG